MSISGSTHETEFQFPSRRAVRRDTREEKQRDALTAELQASLAREDALRKENYDLLQRQGAQSKEFEHRLFNGLQLIAGLLSLQSRTAMPEAAAQLTIAADRIVAFGRVHRRLHLLDHQERVEFKQYLQHLSEDLAGLLFHERAGHAIVVQGANCEVPTALGIPLGFIVNELITNSTKYAKGNITVRFETMSPASHSLSSVGRRARITCRIPANGKGFGMKIVLSLVKQIGGELHILPGDNGSGARFTVKFCSPRPVE